MMSGDQRAEPEKTQQKESMRLIRLAELWLKLAENTVLAEFL